MISEDQQDQAALHALGLLDEEERAEFERAMAADEELRALADELRASTASLALAAGPETLHPPAELKARLLARVTRENPAAPWLREKTRRSGWTGWVPWTIAAAAVLLAFVSGYEWVSMDGRMKETGAKRHPAVMQFAVCQLEPTPDGAAQPRATVVWDPSQRQGKLLVTQLTPPAGGHDYQLWAVEEGKKEPVSAGLVRVDPQGSATVDFKPAGPGDAKVNAFALSLERAGGSGKNEGPILLLGKF